MSKQTRFNPAVILVCSLLLGCSGSGDEAGSSDEAGSPIAPTELRILSTTASSVALQWTDNATDEEAYFVERSPENNQSFQQVAMMGANVAIYTDTGLVSGAYYFYRVRAGRGDRFSGYSNEIQAVVVPNMPPHTPNAIFPANGATGITLSPTLRWSADDPDEDTLSYDVFFGSEQNPPLVSSSLPESLLQRTGLDTNTTYYWKVVAKDEYLETSGPMWTFQTGMGGPTLIVVSPNGGEALVSGRYFEITWTSDQLDSTVDIFLSFDGGNTWPHIVGSGVGNVGQYYWIVTSINSESCRLRIQSSQNSSIYDDSDGDFSTQAILMTQPNGGEILCEYSQSSIRWESDPSIDLVDILASDDGGLNWSRAVASSITNAGYFGWVVAGVNGEGCRLRTRSTTNPSLYDDSDGNFSVRIPAWLSQDSHQWSSLHGVSFANASYGWVVGEYGAIVHTTNGGSTWVAQTSGTTGDLSSVFFTDESNGWTLGEIGTILHTTNGGNTWVAQSSGTTGDLSSMYFTDESNGWAVGDDATILHTTNGGSTWVVQSSGTTDYLLSVFFTDGNSGWAVGSYGTVVQTTNGGSTWVAQSSGTTNYLLSVVFTDGNSGWAVGNYGTIVHTTNGGSTWVAQTSGTTYYLWSVVFTDGNSGWAVGSYGTIVHTTNGGGQWIAQCREANELDYLKAVDFYDESNGWAVGSYGTILHTSTGGE